MEEKRKRGRPQKYTDVKVMEHKINKYFENCRAREVPYTVTGLALALGMTRLELINYSKKDEFMNTIKKAKLEIEAQYEEMLVSGGGNSTGLIFNLKNNYGWKDKQENVNVGITYEDYIKKVESEDEY